MSTLFDLPDLTVTTCEMCLGFGYFDYGDDDDPTPIGCLACGGCGEVECCAGCGAVPQVVNGVERCFCADVTEWEVAA